MTREGLPLCLKLATFENRFAVLHDSSEGCLECSHRFTAAAAPLDGWGPRVAVDSGVHKAVNVPIPYTLHSWVVRCHTDDPTEAQAAFERGAEWVRTGLGP